jgi:PRC-barrel domain
MNARPWLTVLAVTLAWGPAMAQNPPATPPSTSPPSVTVLGSREVQGILGGEVHSTSNETMGRIADVVVDGEGKPRAAIIDFGGFLGVGSRKIAVHWSALHFDPAETTHRITLSLTPDEIKAAPEYKNPEKPAPVVVPVATGPKPGTQ